MPALISYKKNDFGKMILCLVVLQILACNLFSQAHKKNTQHIRPAWSPSGNFFAYLSNVKGSYQLSVSDFKTLASKCITDQSSDITQFKWSPREDKLLFLSDNEVFTINMDGSDLSLIHTNQNIVPFFFDWTPDGKGITYSCPLYDSFTKICKKDLSNGSVAQLTVGRYNDRNFHWSTNGNELAFGSNKNGRFEIFVMDIQSNKKKKLSEFPNNSIDPVFSKDGKSLAFIHDGDGSNVNFDVYLVDKEGKTKRICNFKGYNLPLWHPDGKRLIINSNRNGFWEVFTYELQSSRLAKFGDGLGFSVSPDGLHILLQTHTNGVHTISLMDFKGNKKLLSGLIESN